MRERLLFIARYYAVITALSILYKILFIAVGSGNESLSLAECIAVIYNGLPHEDRKSVV